MTRFQQGLKAFEAGDVEQASLFFMQAVDLAPSQPEYRYLLGVTYVRLEAYEKALKIFQALLTENAGLYDKVYFDMAAAYSAQHRYAKALEILEEAGEARPEDARVLFEKGYVYKHLERFDEAVQSFQTAMEMDPEQTQLAYFMIAAVERERGAFERSARMFHKAVQEAPESALAESARQSLSAVETAAWAAKPWYLTVSFNWGYDDNVPRDPLEEATNRPAGRPGGAGDQFETLHLNGGYKLINQKDMEVGLGYGLISVGYQKWTDSNVTSHHPHLYFQGRYDPVFFRFQYEFSYFYVGCDHEDSPSAFYLTFADDSEAKLQTHSFTPTLSILEPYGLRTDLQAGYQIKDYLDGITGNASRYSFGLLQSCRIPDTECSPRIGYRHAYERSEDSPSTYRSHELYGGVSMPLFAGVRGDLSLAYTKTRFPDFSRTTQRWDTCYTLSAAVHRDFFGRFRGSLVYLYLRNRSDYLENGRDLYSFEKNVFLFSVTYTF